MAVLVTVVLDLKPEIAEEFLGYIDGLLEDTCKRPGFIDIEIKRGQDKPNQIILIENWETVADYEAYFGWRKERDQINAALNQPFTPQYWGETIASK